jgi:ABC-type sugar transport system ATPase subunit
VLAAGYLIAAIALRQYQELNIELDLSIAENIMLGCAPKT